MATTPSLEQLIAMRKKEAEKKNIGSKASTIARYLGNYSTKREGSTKSSTGIYKDSTFDIRDTSWEDNGSDGMAAGYGTTVTYKGNVVFDSGGSTICAYVPGTWETHFDQLYKKASKAAEVAAAERRREIARQQSAREQELRARFGL
ncbi:TPA: hypothetical protein HA251_03800 [Candidatus Woesearchaeota archaeon]|nr:hypothetical protein [Candidatus Woesearchaeota archaeon]